MALRKSFTKRLLHKPTPTPTPISSPSPSLHHSLILPPNASKTNFHRRYLTSPDSPDSGFFQRFLHRRPVYHSGQRRLMPEFLSIPVGDKLNGIDITADHLRIDGLSPPAAAAADTLFDYGVSVNDAKKILRLSQLEKLRAKLRDLPPTSISYSHYLRICVEACDENQHQGAEFAKNLDDSGNVIVLGNVVFLRPEQVAKTMEGLISESIANPWDPRRKELEEMEKEKKKIDDKAKGLVRRELYCGLGLLMAQTIGLMRLTFWELSWDVMEPICFFMTSLHLALAYLFFLRTSTEPTFQGYFYRRFTVKQKKLMLSSNFDIHKYKHLCNACYNFNPHSHPTLHPPINP